MNSTKFYAHLHRQVLVMIGLQIIPGLGFVLIGWYHGIIDPVLLWYGATLLFSVWGYRVYRAFLPDEMSKKTLEVWYRKLIVYFYGAFTLWAVIFYLYVSEEDYHLHYLALFSQIGASVVASALLSSDTRLYRPTITILMIPLVLYFLIIGEWYGYILTYLSVIFAWVLFYSSKSSYNLLMQAEHEASHDQLTGLFNRYTFITLFQRRINTLRESGGYTYLVLIDLDHFKTINDSLGHEIGDVLLQEVARRMRTIGSEEIIARLGGDEFVVIGTQHATKGECVAAAERFCEKLQQELKARYIIDRHHLFISASLGVSVIDKDAANANTFIKEADIAMYEVKSKGRDDIFFFNDELSERIENTLTMERLLHLAVEKKEIYLQFQPQLDAVQKTVGCEVLARWKSKELGMVPPDRFIPIAESTGLIIEIGRFILEESFKAFREFISHGIVLQNFSINISIRQFMHVNFLQDVAQLCTQYLKEGECRYITFEITESILAEDLETVIKKMERIKSHGVRFSLDDFGTGYSSLNYLKRLPLDELKIDRNFVKELPGNEDDAVMVATILGLAKNFRLRTVAEGVENNAQLELLLSLGCETLQGYLFSKPVDKEAFVAFCSSNNTL